MANILYINILTFVQAMDHDASYFSAHDSLNNAKDFSEALENFQQMIEYAPTPHPRSNPDKSKLYVPHDVFAGALRQMVNQVCDITGQVWVLVTPALKSKPWATAIAFRDQDLKKVIRGFVKLVPYDSKLSWQEFSQEYRIEFIVNPEFVKDLDGQYPIVFVDDQILSGHSTIMDFASFNLILKRDGFPFDVYLLSLAFHMEKEGIENLINPNTRAGGLMMKEELAEEDKDVNDFPEDIQKAVETYPVLAPFGNTRLSRVLYHEFTHEPIQELCNDNQVSIFHFQEFFLPTTTFFNFAFFQTGDLFNFNSGDNGIDFDHFHYKVYKKKLTKCVKDYHNSEDYHNSYDDGDAENMTKL